MSRSSRLSRNSRGDTIVEVLICIAMLSLILGAAYSLATRSQVSNLQAQERSIASNLVEKQAELLRAYANRYGELPANNHFCIVSISGIPANDIVDIPDTNNVPLSCKPDSSSFYSVIVYSPAQAASELGATSSSDTYGVRIKWASASGKGDDEVKILYRINTIVTNGFDSVGAN